MAELCSISLRIKIVKISDKHKNKIYTICIVSLCLAVAGPELGIGIELVGLVELFGVELFLFCFVAPLLFYWYQLGAWIYKIDPYFFIPSRKQILACPGLIAHSIPGYVIFILWASSIFVFVS